MARPKKNKKEVVDEKPIGMGGEPLPKGPAGKAIKEAMTNDVLKKYEFMLGPVVDRSADLFKLDIPSLNSVLGGGLPRGQMVHLYGAEGAGKSTLAAQIIASVQHGGGRVLYIDSENTVTKPYLEQLGVDTDPKKLTFVPKPGTAELVLDMVEDMIRIDGYELVVIDTVAALVPAELQEKSNQQDSIGVQARLFSKALLKLNNAAVNSGTIILFVNQLRANIQTMPGAKKWTTPCGNALKFYANIAMYVQRIGSLTEGDVTIGQEVQVRIEKNKIAPPQRVAVLNLIYGEGFRRDIDLILSAIKAKVIRGAGAWYSFGELKWQGQVAIRNYAKEHPEFLDQLENILYGPTEEVPAETTTIADPGQEPVPTQDAGEEAAAE